MSGDRKLASSSLAEGRATRPPAAHKPAPAPRSAEPSDDGPQLFAPPHRTKDSRDRPAASVPAIPGSPARFSTAKEPSIFPSLPRSSSIRLLSAILPLSRSSFRQSQNKESATKLQVP